MAKRKTKKNDGPETVVLPGRVDPVELKPSRRDTMVKDALREAGKAEHADPPVRPPFEGGQWETGA